MSHIEDVSDGFGSLEMIQFSLAPVFPTNWKLGIKFEGYSFNCWGWG